MDYSYLLKQFYNDCKANLSSPRGREEKFSVGEYPLVGEGAMRFEENVIALVPYKISVKLSSWC